MHNQRFFSYLSLFTFFMLILVSGSNYLVMFVGWEGIGIVSFLLISFWYTRISAVKAATQALIMNRVGDMLLSIGFFAMIALFGSLDYATVFSLSPYINETYITIIGLLIFAGATAKSAQIPLHVWLPASMEGLNILNKILILLIFIYNFKNLSSFNINLYLSILPIISSIPKSTLQTITGNMLGDGSISRKNYNSAGIFAMTMDAYSINYLEYLNKHIYSNFTTINIYPYPNVLLPQHKGKKITQYKMQSKTHPLFTALHDLWYKWDNETNKFIKIIPLYFSEMFSEISLAYWIMDDGYFDSYGRTKTVLLCTESFSKEDCITLQNLLLNKLNIKSTLKIRDKNNNRYRIRISKTSMEIVISLVKPYMYNDFLYKLGI